MKPWHLQSTQERNIEYGHEAALAVDWHRDQILVLEPQVQEISAIDISDMPGLVQAIVAEKLQSLKENLERNQTGFKNHDEIAGRYIGRQVEGSDTFFASVGSVN